jgi:Protein of unknown function (DUF3047)
MIAGLVVFGFVGAMVLIVSPLHRAFYLDRFTRPAQGSAGRGLTVPAVPDVFDAATPQATAAIAAGKHPLVPDADGRIRIPLTAAPSGRAAADGVPAGWELKEFTGRARLELQRTEIGPALRLRSEAGSFALYRDVVVDLAEFPFLSWSWKVMQLPPGGDVRQAATDDQAAQVYVVFPRWPAPRTSSDVIGYVWDTTAPAGAQLVSRKAANVRIIVLESGPSGLGTWRRYQRNVVADYIALFGRQPPRVGSIALMADANDTGGTVEAWIGQLAFSRVDQKTPTPMLR